MNNHFKVLKNDQLTLADELIYSLLSCYSDKDGVSNISRQALANKSGIKKLDTITAHTNKLEKLGLISKSYTTHSGKKLAHYKITNPQQNFM